jgi:hypothetical protein
MVLPIQSETASSLMHWSVLEQVWRVAAIG